LKKIVLLAVIVFGVWSFYGKELRGNRSADRGQPENVTQLIEKDQELLQTASRFQCDGRVHCSQMTSRAEAEFFLRNCPNTKMDGDGDGIPCENDSRF
jgi:hypothetical protein